MMDAFAGEPVAENDKQKERVILVFEGRAADFTNTEKVRVKDDGSVETTMVHDVKVWDEDGHGATIRAAQPWNIRPGEYVRIRMERTQARLEEAGE